MQRLDYKQANPGSYRTLFSAEDWVRKSGLDNRLIDLVYVRVSQINGCERCLVMHRADLIKAGESPARLEQIAQFRQSTTFSAQERVALEWAEALTRLGPDPVPDELYQRAREIFGETALVSLTLAVTTINAWNRVNIAFKVAAPAGL